MRKNLVEFCLKVIKLPSKPTFPPMFARIVPLLTAVLMAAFMLSSAEAGTPPIKAIVKKHQAGEYDLNVNGMRRIDANRLEAILAAGKFQTYQVPRRPNVADDFLYRIYRSKQTNGYLIVRTGGIAGVYDVFASGQLPGGN